MAFSGTTARSRVFWRWLHAGRFHQPSTVETALAAWPEMLWGATLPRELRPTARRRQWARAVLAVERARQEREDRQLAAGWTLYPYDRLPTSCQIPPKPRS